MNQREPPDRLTPVFKKYFLHPINKTINFLIVHNSFIILAMLLGIIGILFIWNDPFNLFFENSNGSIILPTPKNKISFIAPLISSFSIVFTLIFFYTQKINNRKKEEISDRKLWVDYNANFLVSAINTFDNNFSDQNYYKSCFVKDSSNIKFKKVFDIYPARRRNQYPFLKIKNNSLFDVLNLKVKIKFDGREIEEDNIPIFETGKNFLIKTNDKYNNFLTNKSSIIIVLDYFNPVTNQNIVTDYMVTIDDDCLYFITERDGKAWAKFQTRIIKRIPNLLKSSKIIHSGSSFSIYDKEALDWYEYYQNHKAGDYNNNNRYLEVNMYDFNIHDLENIFCIKNLNPCKYALIAKQGLYVTSVNKTLSSVKSLK